MNAHRLHVGSPGHGSHTLPAAQRDLVLQTSSPTAPDHTQKAESGTGIGSHRTTVDSWTSWPTDSQPHTKRTDKSDFTQPTAAYTGPVPHTHFHVQRALEAKVQIQAL